MQKAKEFKLAITPNYGLMVRKLMLFLICYALPFVLLMILLKNEIIKSDTIQFEIVLPIYFALCPILLIFFIKKTYYLSKIRIAQNALYITKNKRTIFFKDILKYRIKTVKGHTTLFIFLSNGRKMAVGPYFNFSIKAETIFQEFICAFELKFNNN